MIKIRLERQSMDMVAPLHGKREDSTAEGAAPWPLASLRLRTE